MKTWTRISFIALALAVVPAHADTTCGTSSNLFNVSAGHQGSGISGTREGAIAEALAAIAAEVAANDVPDDDSQ